MRTVVDRQSSGISGLDEVLGGGFPTGQMYLIEGNPGAGKTTMGLHFLRDGARRGDKCCYVVLSESEKALSRLAASHGRSLDGIDVIESNDQDPRSDYSIYEPSEVELLVMTQTGLIGENVASPIDLSYLADAVLPES